MHTATQTANDEGIIAYAIQTQPRTPVAQGQIVCECAKRMEKQLRFWFLTAWWPVTIRSVPNHFARSQSLDVCLFANVYRHVLLLFSYSWVNKCSNNRCRKGKQSCCDCERMWTDGRSTGTIQYNQCDMAHRCMLYIHRRHTLASIECRLHIHIADVVDARIVVLFVFEIFFLRAIDSILVRTACQMLIRIWQ